MAWWLSWLERRPVTAEVEGSNPFRVAACEYPSTHKASKIINFSKEWTFRDSNPGPIGYEPIALTS